MQIYVQTFLMMLHHMLALPPYLTPSNFTPHGLLVGTGGGTATTTTAAQYMYALPANGAAARRGLQYTHRTTLDYCTLPLSPRIAPSEVLRCAVSQLPLVPVMLKLPYPSTLRRSSGQLCSARPFLNHPALLLLSHLTVFHAILMPSATV